MVEGDNAAPWRSTDCPSNGLIVEMFADCTTLDKVWKRSATIYGSNRCRCRLININLVNMSMNY